MKLINKPITEKQKSFSKLIVENSFGEHAMSNTNCAKKARHALESGSKSAWEFTNSELYPHVCKYIEELKEEFREKK